MALSRTARLTLCAMPQPGWGGTTLAGFTESISIRPDVHADSEAECRELLDRMVAAGLARSLGGEPEVVVVPGAGTATRSTERWELTDAGHAIVLGPPEHSRTDGTVSEVLLELEPGIVASSASAEAQA